MRVFPSLLPLCALVMTAGPLSAQEFFSCCEAEVAMYFQRDKLPPIGDAPHEIWGFDSLGNPLPPAPNARIVPGETFADAIVPCDHEGEGMIEVPYVPGRDNRARVWVGISSNEVTNPVTGEPAAGVQGWSIVIGVDGDVFPVEDQGVDSRNDSAEMLEESVLQERLVREPGKPDRVGAGFALGGLGLESAQVVEAGHRGQWSVVAWGVLSQRQPVTLPRTSSATILNVQVAPEVDPTPDRPVVSGPVFVKQHLRGGEAVPTIVTVDRESAGVCRGQPVNVSFVLASAPFIRCDVNADGKLDIADVVWTLEEAFRDGPATRCPEAADCNDDGRRGEVTDVLAALEFLFLGGPPPPPPFPECGRLDDLEFADCPPGSTGCLPER